MTSNRGEPESPLKSLTRVGSFPALSAPAVGLLWMGDLATAMGNHQIIVYLVQQLSTAESNSEATSRNIDEAEVEIVCNGRVLPANMNLNTVRQCVWRSPGDLELAYRLKTTERTPS